MEIKFDISAAESLITQMDSFCKSIQSNGIELNNLVTGDSKWNDKQFEAFRNNIEAIVEGLEEILGYDSEYINTFIERVRELRG